MNLAIPSAPPPATHRPSTRAHFRAHPGARLRACPHVRLAPV